MSDSSIAIKRAFDIVTSAIGLVLLSPLLLVLALLVKTTSRGPVIYRQQRIGMYGMPFYIYKFRTMCDNAEESVPQLTDTDDPRITPLGRMLRKYRLDELPQLWNVLRGDMSIVGPRPEREYFINQIMQRAPYYCLLYRIRPGLTSWGPIKVGYTDTIEKMVDRLNYDIAYMENMSLHLDLKIMFYTISVIFNGEGQ
jgi:lipopolysaccharide/colanic/teichoic acid biosynthesis glycosyltransferase